MGIGQDTGEAGSGIVAFVPFSKLHPEFPEFAHPEFDTSALYEAAEDSTDLVSLPRVLRRWGDKAADRRAKRMQRDET